MMMMMMMMMIDASATWQSHQKAHFNWFCLLGPSNHDPIVLFNILIQMEVQDVKPWVVLMRNTLVGLKNTGDYSSSHNHGSGKWVPGRCV